MKKTPLKRKTPLRKKSKESIRVIQDKIWDLCKKIIRIQYPNVCYTCGAENLEGRNWQTGHMISKAHLGAFMKYDLRLLRPQCMACNIHKGGLGAVFIENMREIEGDDYVDEIMDDRKIIVDRAYDYYLKLLDYYTRLHEELRNDIHYGEHLSYPQFNFAEY